jgi:hypothetical protein
VSLIFHYPATLPWSSADPQPESASFLVAMWTGISRAALLVNLFGKLFCLAAAFCVAAQGPLMWSIGADLLVFALRLSEADGLKIGATPAPVAPWLSLLGLVLLVVAMRRTAAAMGEPHYERRSQRVVWWLSAVSPGFYVAGRLGGRIVPWMGATFQVLYVGAWLIGLVLLARCVRELQDLALRRI